MNLYVAVVCFPPDWLDLTGDRISPLSDVQIELRSRELEGAHLETALSVNDDGKVEMGSQEHEVVVEVLVEEATRLQVGGVLDHRVGQVAPLFIRNEA